MLKRSFVSLSICIILVAVGCEDKNTPTPDPVQITIPQILLWVKGEDVFQQCDYGLLSQWVLTDKEKNLVFNSGPGNGSIDYFYKDYNEELPLSFPLIIPKVEVSTTILLPPVSQEPEEDVPFSITFPFSFLGKDIPEEFINLTWIKALKNGYLSLWFDDETPFSYLVSDLLITLPPSWSFIRGDGTSRFLVGPDSENTAHLEYAYLFSEHDNRSYVGSQDNPFYLRFYGDYQIPEEQCGILGRCFQINSSFTLSGVLHLTSSLLKEGGASWPGEITLHGAFSAQGEVASTRGKMNYPSEYALPRNLSFSSLRNYLPLSFQEEASVLHLFDGRVFLDFLNRSPFNAWITGTFEGRNKGTVLYSLPFGEEERITAAPFHVGLSSEDMVCVKHIAFSEFNHFPVDPAEFYPSAEGQVHVSLLMDGLSHLLEGAPDEYIIGNLMVHRDPEEEVTLDYRYIPIYFRVGGRIDMPLEAGSSFQIVSRHNMTLPAFQPEEGRSVEHLILEGTLRSTFPLNVELMDVSADDTDLHISVETLPLKASDGFLSSSQPIRIQAEAPYDLSAGIELQFTFRLFADENCQGRSLSSDMSIMLSDINLRY